jgi:phosphatidate cytidylyltransferase
MRSVPLELIIPWCALGIAYLVTMVAGRSLDERTSHELMSRIQTWLKILVFFTIPTLLGPAAMVGAMAIVSYLTLREFISITQLGASSRTQCFTAYALIPATYAVVYFHPKYPDLFSLPVLAAVSISCISALKGETKIYIAKSSTLLWGYTFLVFNLSLSANFVSSSADIAFGGIYTLLLLTVVNDVMQYVWGRAIGKRKLFPAVSPGKTVGGAVGGMLSTALASMLLAPHLIGLSSAVAICLGFVVSLAGVLGDLCFSALKRNLNIKDSGSALPGHGGYLDRVDSLTLSAPAFFSFCMLVR